LTKDALDNVKNIDENSTAWKIFGGFSGSEFFGLEGGYRDFGDIESTISGDLFETSTTGLGCGGHGAAPDRHCRCLWQGRRHVLVY